jgi:hypothetical protein
VCHNHIREDLDAVIKVIGQLNALAIFTFHVEETAMDLINRHVARDV